MTVYGVTKMTAANGCQWSLDGSDKLFYGLTVGGFQFVPVLDCPRTERVLVHWLGR